MMMDEAIRNHDLKNYYQLQKDYHSIYIDRCDNSELVSTLKLLKKKFIRQTYSEKKNENMTNVLLKTNEEHKRIIELFKENDKGF